jgi:hypothetical protein
VAMCQVKKTLSGFGSKVKKTLSGFGSKVKKTLSGFGSKVKKHLWFSVEQSDFIGTFLKLFEFDVF